LNRFKRGERRNATWQVYGPITSYNFYIISYSPLKIHVITGRKNKRIYRVYALKIFDQTVIISQEVCQTKKYEKLRQGEISFCHNVKVYRKKLKRLGGGKTGPSANDSAGNFS
jgi:hypothetical protein